jgi:hypothetical protein
MGSGACLDFCNKPRELGAVDTDLALRAHRNAGCRIHRTWRAGKESTKRLRGKQLTVGFCDPASFGVSTAAPEGCDDDACRILVCTDDSPK